MVPVYVGPALETFYVHEDLLILHSRSVENYIRNLENPDCMKIKFCSIKPALFADFVSWIYTGKFFPAKSTSLGVAHPCTELWAMGSTLQVVSRAG